MADTTAAAATATAATAAAAAAASATATGHPKEHRSVAAMGEWTGAHRRSSCSAHLCSSHHGVPQRSSAGQGGCVPAAGALEGRRAARGRRRRAPPLGLRRGLPPGERPRTRSPLARGLTGRKTIPHRRCTFSGTASTHGGTAAAGAGGRPAGQPPREDPLAPSHSPMSLTARRSTCARGPGRPRRPPPPPPQLPTASHTSHPRRYRQHHRRRRRRHSRSDGRP